MSLWVRGAPAPRRWSTSDVPSQAGRAVVLTGGNSGVGLEAARALARRGARVLVGCRRVAEAEGALAGARAEASEGGSLEVLALDLASLASVRSFAAAVLARVPALHALVNNAGIMAVPARASADGFELQLATNHLGHFALTGLLLDALRAAPAARVVTVSSLVLWASDDVSRAPFELRGRYHPWRAYARSKLANVLFAAELQRRFERAGWAARSLACHPGYAATQLQQRSVQASGGSRLAAGFYALGARVLAQSAADGALPTLYAATAEAAEGGAFYGPRGWLQLAGQPALVLPSARARDENAARRLWERSCDATGVRFERLAALGDA